MPRLLEIHPQAPTPCFPPFPGLEPDILAFVARNVKKVIQDDAERKLETYASLIV